MTKSTKLIFDKEDAIGMFKSTKVNLFYCPISWATDEWVDVSYHDAARS